MQVTLPVIPLPKDVVLFPGIRARIPLTRTQVATILSVPEQDSAQDQRDHVQIACVPRKSSPPSTSERLDMQDPSQDTVDANRISEQDLFEYGVAAKIVAIDARVSGSVTAFIESLARLRILKYTRTSPTLQVEAELEHDS